MAVYVTVVVPNVSVPPAGPVIVTGPAMSEAVAAPGVTKAPPTSVASTVIGAGHEMEGGVVSTTVIVVVQELWFPD